MINRLLNVVTYAIYGRISRRSNDNARIGFREARGSLPPPAVPSVQVESRLRNSIRAANAAVGILA